MSLREELDYVIGRRREYNDAETGCHWEAFASAAYRLIRDHGQALLDALEDAERMDQLELSQRADVYWHKSGDQELAGYELGCGGQYSTARDALDAEIAARSKTADQAIDAAIKGDG